MSGFTFKEFHIDHSQCAMKVGTDGIMLGAWANVENFKSALDIGTGSGLIALMLKQRNPQMAVTAIEIDGDAFSQAKKNVQQSKWQDIALWQGDVLSFEPGNQFDLIVSNPPYFNDALQSDNKQRMLARHTDSLSFSSLSKKVAHLLSVHGVFSVVIPCSELSLFRKSADQAKLKMVKMTYVKTTQRKVAKRVLLSFMHADVETDKSVESEIVIHDETGNYSTEYRTLCRDFYLNF